MINHFCYLAVLVGAVLTASQACAKSIIIQVTPDNLGKHEFAFSLTAKEVGDATQFQLVITPKAGKLPPGRFFVARFNVLDGDPKIAAAVVKALEHEGVEIVYSFRLPRDDVKKATWSVESLAYSVSTDENGEAIYVPRPASDIYRFKLSEFPSARLDDADPGKCR